MKKIDTNTVDHYLNSFDGLIKEKLLEIRTIISTAAPAASEKISYGIPTFYQDGNLVHFGGSKNHLGFYPGAGAIKTFAGDLAGYTTSKGSVHFPYHEKLPVALIKKIVKFRVGQNAEKAVKKRPAKKDAATGSFLLKLSQPAARALQSQGIHSLKKLSSFTRSEILGLHGMGPASIPILEAALRSAGLTFKK